MTRPLTLALVLFGLGACSANDDFAVSAPEAGAPPPTGAARAPDGWRESFDHRDQLGRLEGSAFLDTNLGQPLPPRRPDAHARGPGHALPDA